MITVRECQYDEMKKFRDLEGECHYMGESHGAGDMIRLIFEEDGKWIALKRRCELPVTQNVLAHQATRRHV